MLDMRWLRELYAMRLNRYSLVASVASRFTVLEDRYHLGANYDVLAAKAECLQYQHDAAASHAITRKLMAYDALDRRTAAFHYANLLALGRSTDLYKLAHAAVRNAPKGTGTPLQWLMVMSFRAAVAVTPMRTHTHMHTLLPTPSPPPQTPCRGMLWGATTCRCPSMRWG